MIEQDLAGHDTGRLAEDAPTAAVLVIGDEILSGRTQDANLTMIAGFRNRLGIDVMEARVVSDITARIVTAVNALRRDYTYVFTTGGIGPTHDDITADAIAAAFEVPIGIDSRACALLEAHYPAGEFTAARQRMARIPQGADLIENPVSTAPGFRLANVFVLAGIPVVAKAMMEGLEAVLTGGVPLLSRSIKAALPESQLAGVMGDLQNRYPSVRIGSYPYFRAGVIGTNVVVRTRDAADLADVALAVEQAIRVLGGEPMPPEEA